ncbi:hypothetical protein COV13_00860 [Candidatus Woesearchaeota archaeon CG10_big_fil_rev_8_21_14_0_10_32_9]|nr:MAG: hypothetical protein COV13_00860 [Candidatus Woesearchaeota archaeon CG10_big_fil_rev_8_21_14_0_10_32_9]
MNVLNIGLEDIDNVVFNSFKQQLKNLEAKKVFPEEFFKDIQERKYPYVYNFLFSSSCQNISLYRDLFRELYLEKSKSIKEILLKQRVAGKNSFSDFDLDLRSSFFASLDDFDNSAFFLEGVISDIADLNRKLHEKGPNYLNIGITKRGTGLKKSNPEAYANRVRKTIYWKNTNKTYLDKIYFESQKENALFDIKQDYFPNELNFMYLMEDDPENVEGMLKNEIPVILIHYFSEEHNKIEVYLKRRYSKLLTVVDTHAEAKIAALDIAKKYE